jgi:arylsulfatase A-like enzyme
MLEASSAVASADYPLDGQSLLGLLNDASNVTERPLFWRMNHRGQRAMRHGNFKYLRVDGNDYVFDLTQDARERANLGKHQPERLAAMRDAWEAWNATMPAIPEDATVSLGYDKTDMPQR